MVRIGLNYNFGNWARLRTLSYALLNAGQELILAQDSWYERGDIDALAPLGVEMNTLPLPHLAIWETLVKARR